MASPWVRSVNALPQSRSARRQVLEGARHATGGPRLIRVTHRRRGLPAATTDSTGAMARCPLRATTATGREWTAPGHHPVGPRRRAHDPVAHPIPEAIMTLNEADS